MLRVWGRRSSSNVQILMWCIGELGLPYERYDAGQRYGVNNTPAFLAMNPNGTIPVLIDGDSEPLWESAAILRYLAGRYGHAPLWPEEGMARAHVDKWAEWAKINVNVNFTRPIFWQVVRTPPAARNLEAISQAVATLDKSLDIAEKRLTDSAFLAGDEFTLADIHLGHMLFRYFDIPIPRPARPALDRYYAVLKQRPAFQEHVMVSYDELKVQA